MNIKLFASNTSDAACGAVIDALRAKNTLGSRHIVIAPDKFSLSVEKEIFARLNLEGAFNIDVMSFVRLAMRVLKKDAYGCLSKAGAVLVFKRVINASLDQLTYYSRVAKSPNFAREMYAVISSIRNNGYTVQDLERCIDSLAGSTARKMSDIRLLYKNYLDMLDGGYMDGTTRLEKLAAVIPDTDFIKESDIYIVGFGRFSAKQYGVIEQLGLYAKSVSIAVTSTNYGQNDNFYPAETTERLVAIAAKYGAKIVPENCYAILKPPFDVINRELFSYSSGHSDSKTDNVVLYKESNVFDEFKGVGKEIIDLVSNAGYKYGDIAIVNCNGAYNDLLKSILDRLDVPCFIDKKYNLRDSLTAKLLLGALTAAEYGLRQDKVLEYLKNPLSGVSPESADCYENYALAHGLTFNGFLREAPDEQKEVAGRIVALASAFNKNVTTTAVFVDSCAAFLMTNDLQTRLLTLCDGIDDVALKTSNLQSSDRLNAVLTELKTIYGDEEATFSEHVNTLTAAIEAVETSVIPQYADCVFIGNVDDSRYNKLKALFVVSATGDVFPAPHTYPAIISAKDSDLLEREGLRLFPTPLDQVKEDVFLTLDLFTKPQQRLYFGYAAMTPDGKATRPSGVFGELKRITGAEPCSLAKKHSLAAACDQASLKSALGSERNAYFEYFQNAKRVSNNGDLVAHNMNIAYSSLSDNHKKNVSELLYETHDQAVPDASYYFVKTEAGKYLTSVSQIESYFACPYRHHLQYGLKLKPRDEGQIEKTDLGIIIHRVLELFFAKTLGSLRSMSKEARLKLVNTICEAVFSDEYYVPQNANVFTQNILAELKKECISVAMRLADKVDLSRFSPVGTEQSFGDACITLSNGDIYSFKGKIDRIDALDGDRKKVFVVDYKTGSGLDSEVKDIYFGNALQLWFYLHVLYENGFSPVGAFYLPINGNEDSLLLKGFFDKSELNNIEVSDCAQSETADRVLCGKLKIKDGEVDAGKYAVSGATVSKYIQYSVDAVTLALDEISAGHIDKSPRKGACKYCPYLSVCGGAEDEEQRETLVKQIPASFKGDSDDKMD